MFSLPRTATAPFCPSEVKGTVTVELDLHRHHRLITHGLAAVANVWLWVRC